MELNQYLQRIQFDDPGSADERTLREIHVAQLLSVPFENLSIHAGEPIALEDEALFEKIVGRKRGGFCYELNGLFAWLLRELGFNVSMLSAEVANSSGAYSPAFDHMVLLVRLRKPWLVDVGFGDLFGEPLPLVEGKVITQGTRSFRLDRERAEKWVLMQCDTEAEWQAQYRFDLTPHAYPDYQPMCAFHQTSPDSHFTQRRICSRMTEEGRVTLSGMRLITTTLGERVERELADEREYADMLKLHFGVVLPARMRSK